MQLKKIKYDHYVVVTDDPIKEGDWYYHIIRKTIHNTSEKADYFVNNTKYNDFKKITHSTEPLELLSENGLSGMGFSKVRPLNIFEVKELIGEVNIEKKAEEDAKSYVWDFYSHTCSGYSDPIDGFINGYNKCLEDNKDKKYTEEDLRKAMGFGYDMCHQKRLDKWGFENFIQSFQPKTEWEVEIIDGQLKLK